MNDRNETQFDVTLREHLRAKLDSQLGRATQRFREAVESAPAGTIPLPEPGEPPRHWRMVGWSIGLAGAALAAGLAIAIVLPAMLEQRTAPIELGGIAMHPQNGSDGGPTHLATADPASPRDVEHALTWNTLDRGTVYVAEDLPLRSVVRQASETVSWYDPARKAHVEMTVPRDEVMFVGFGSQ